MVKPDPLTPDYLSFYGYTRAENSYLESFGLDDDGRVGLTFEGPMSRRFEFLCRMMGISTQGTRKGYAFSPGDIGNNPEITLQSVPPVFYHEAIRGTRGDTFKTRVWYPDQAKIDDSSFNGDDLGDWDFHDISEIYKPKMIPFNCRITETNSTPTEFERFDSPVSGTWDHEEGPSGVLRDLELTTSNTNSDNIVGYCEECTIAIDYQPVTHGIGGTITTVPVTYKNDDIGGVNTEYGYFISTEFEPGVGQASVDQRLIEAKLASQTDYKSQSHDVPSHVNFISGRWDLHWSRVDKPDHAEIEKFVGTTNEKTFLGRWPPGSLLFRGPKIKMIRLAPFFVTFELAYQFEVKMTIQDGSRVGLWNKTPIPGVPGTNEIWGDMRAKQGQQPIVTITDFDRMFVHQ